jgi:RimJ/RimL family protein N-acetyltransferase
MTLNGPRAAVLWVQKSRISERRAAAIAPERGLPSAVAATIIRAVHTNFSSGFEMTIEVRDASVGDLAGCHRCLDAVAKEARWLSRLSAPPIERYTAFVAGLREANAPQVVAVDSEVVGWCDITPDASPVRAHVGSLGMGLLATHRGQGLGRRLLTLAIDRARERELERIELSVLHDNDAARALYERLGFQIEGRRIRDWRRDGVYRDSILMALNFVHR